jgi:hypothetical protein
MGSPVTWHAHSNLGIRKAEHHTMVCTCCCGMSLCSQGMPCGARYFSQLRHAHKPLATVSHHQS